ncbi:MAG: class I tRNA ligase family protein [Ginsengibacter sp.]
MLYQLNLPPEKKYLLVPEMPTPNGRMHLGHIAGPYLKMDVVRRKVERGNGTAYLFSGSDVYESYVELKARESGLTEKEVCNKFHSLIINDLKSLHIHFDNFINPLDGRWNERFIKRHRQLMQLLLDAGTVVEREETFFYDPVEKKYLNGCWIKGYCPNCKSPAGSYLCEICGTHYRPEDIFNAADYPHAVEVKGKALYLKLDTGALLNKVDAMGIGSFRSVLERYLQLQGPYVRMTTPQRTGIEWNVDSGAKQVLFTYSALLFFSIFCGDICQEQFALDKHPFAKDSEYIVIASFGIDNAIPYLGAVLAGGMALQGFKPFDYYFCNYFYHLNGEKFSTSRQHVIWGSDITDVAHIQPDAVRYYLLKQNPEFEVKNFDIDDFIGTVNCDLYHRFNDAITSALECLVAGQAYEADKFIVSPFRDLVLLQSKELEPTRFNFSGVLRAIEDWVSFYNRLDEKERRIHSYWWLKGFAFLSYPVMPELCTALWKSLAVDGSLNAADFFKVNKYCEPFDKKLLFRKVGHGDIEKCLPTTLRQKLTQ